jgi:hypothetical protein
MTEGPEDMEASSREAALGDQHEKKTPFEISPQTEAESSSLRPAQTVRMATTGRIKAAAHHIGDIQSAASLWLAPETTGQKNET